MDTTAQNLWRRLSTFEVDDDTAQLSFLDRLARENRWDRAHTDRVFAEYRRFVLLAMTADHQVTPSEDVDQVWHLHLTYTHSYWDELCGGVLGRPLHHQPTVGGAAQGAHWHDTYTQTLESYRATFGEDPPADIWPAAAERFAGAGALKWVDTSRYWAVPKRPVRIAHRAVTGVGAVLLLLVGLATAAAAQDGPSTVETVVSWGLMIAFIVVIGVVWSITGRSRRRQNGKGGGCGGAGCGADASGCGGGGGGCGGGGCGGCGG